MHRRLSKFLKLFHFFLIAGFRQESQSQSQLYICKYVLVSSSSLFVVDSVRILQVI